MKRIHFLTVCIGLFTCMQSFGQNMDCRIVLSGVVLDSNTLKPLDDAAVAIEETQTGGFTDSTGKFRITGLCKGKAIVSVSRIGSKTLLYEITLKKDTTITLFLEHPGLELGEVEVIQEKHTAPLSSISSEEIKGIALLKTRGETLGESLKEISGLNSIQTGPTISKPVIHGLYANRILILNNGVRQEGQQWSNDHAPEIDPFIANKITVIKGAASIRYGADAIAGVILLEPADLPDEPGIGATFTEVAGSNGLMGGTSAAVEGAFGKKFTGLSWRVQGTLKRAGNYRTAHYYLENTGFFEGDFSVALQYHHKNYGADVFFSEYNNKAGIYTGSDVGNLTNLLAAFARKVPITPSYFTYKINRSYDIVRHDLLKANAWYDFKKAGKLEAVYAQQWDERAEYDVDLPYTNDPAVLKKPEVAFNIITSTLDIAYHHKSWHNISGSFGLNAITQGNVYEGLSSLIPNFRNYGGGVYCIEKYTRNKFTVEAGIRDDYLWERAFVLDYITLVKSHPTHAYNNVSFTAGVSYRPLGNLSFDLNFGSAFRPPSINELYIEGVHLSAATYELGDSLLKSERSYNTTASVKYRNKWFNGEVVAYFNYFNNYIYSKPQLTSTGVPVTVTLYSGFFPLSVYTQTNAYFTGTDVDLTFYIWKGLSLQSKLSVLRAYNVSAHDYLVLAPANRWENIAKYEFTHIKKLSSLYFTFSDLWVMKQSHVPPNSDYVPPPKAYVLLNAGVGCSFPIRKQKMDIDLSVYNLANASYRDYLNRFRYYTDDLGINAMLRVDFTLNYYKK
ncbi:MAG TPA: TonB-dependent receptor, partial [Chitinophagales bacterium]|nr:TonB-dependent receptor [Chitinophagales bacterium]